MSLDAEKLYTDYYRKVRSFIASKVNSYQDAEDLTSDVFVKVYKKLDTFDPKKANVSTWIYTIARNTVIDFYRTSNQTLEYDDSILIEDDEGESIINEDNLEILARALEILSEKERDILILHYYEGHKLKDIAVMMNISYTYAKILHKKALMSLQSKFKKMTGE